MKQLLEVTQASGEGESKSMLIISDPNKINADSNQNDEGVEEEDDDEEEGDKKGTDEVKRGREQFLKIYKDDDQNDEASQLEEDGGPKEIKFRREQPEEDGDLETKTGHLLKLGKENGEGKPLIQEIKTIAPVNQVVDGPSQIAQVEKVKEDIVPVVVPFKWDEAVKVEAAHQFFHTKEFVFVNFNMKGYNKITDIRYALSQNELLVEIKEPSTLKVHRLCKTLNKEVNVELSSVELLIDFIAVKLRKDDKDVSWDQLGYDIKDFTIPMRGQMKSNFLSLPVIKQEPKPQVQEQSSTENQGNADKENTDTSNAKDAG